MQISLLSLLLSFLVTDTQTPNFYPGLVSAREASKKSQQEMIIFFGDKNCNSCEAAWVAFTKDASATNQYISTRMDIKDFDGGIFYDLLKMDGVPSWIVLSPEGIEQERWQGGWKDASGQPTAFDKSTQVSNVEKPEPATKEVPKSSPTVSTSAQKKEPNPPTSNPVPIKSNSIGSSGLVIQAGYFGSETNALKLMSDLKSKGFPTFEMQVVEQNGATFYRVVSTTPYASEADVTIDQQKLSGAGFKSSVKSK